MNKLLLLFILGIFTCAKSNAQQWQWAQRLGNVKSDKITTIKTDDSGYIYIAGYFSTSTPIGTNSLMLNFTANSNSKEAFIAKLDSNGYCYWAKSGGSSFDDRVLGMDVDSAGNSIIVGTYWSSNFNMGPVNVSGLGGGDQCFVVRHDRLGNELWGTWVSSNGGDDQGLDVATDKFGNSYIVGFMSSNLLRCGGTIVTASNTNTLYQQHAYWLAKLDNTGTFEWAKTFGNLPFDTSAGKYIERDIAVCVDEADGVYVTGGFDHTWPFGNTTLTSSGGYDIFVMKYDSSGNFKWATPGGSRKDDWSNGICSDKNGHIYVVGEHRDSLIMDTVLVKNYDKRDAFILKMDAATGKPIWGKRAGSDEGGERGNDVWADDKCNVYMTGDINSGAKFGDNIIVPTGKYEEAFVARISPEGKWMWVATGGGLDSNDRGNGIVKGKGGQVYVGGFFRSPATYGSSTLTSVGSSDAFFARLKDNMVNTSGIFRLLPPTKTILCWGDTAKYAIDDHSSFSINPTNGVTFNSDSTKMVFSPTATTTYTLSGAGVGSCPELDTITFTISVGEPPFTFTKPIDTVLCFGESIVLPIATHDFLSITPNTGYTLNSTQNAVTFNPTTTTTYTLIGYKLGVCPSYDTLVFTILAAPDPIASFELKPAYVLIDKPTFTFVNNSTNANKYKWYRQNALFSVSTNPSYTESSAGNFCYTLVAESNLGCVDSATQCGDVIKDERVFFPNAFSPNNDGKNDDFKPIILNIDLPSIKDYNFKIVNRYGQEVYATKDPYFGWDGKFGDRKCEMGTYFYICQFTTPMGKKYDMKGDVTLVK